MTAVTGVTGRQPFENLLACASLVRKCSYLEEGIEIPSTVNDKPSFQLFTSEVSISNLLACDSCLAWKGSMAN